MEENLLSKRGRERIEGGRGIHWRRGIENWLGKRGKRLSYEDDGKKINTNRKNHSEGYLEQEKVMEQGRKTTGSLP